MKISELIALLEQRKEEYGDVLIKIYENRNTDFVPVSRVEPVSLEHQDFGLEIY